METIGGTNSTVTKASVSGSAGISSNATVSGVQAVPPSISNIVLLQTIE